MNGIYKALYTLNAPLGFVKLFQLKPFSLWLGHANSAVNPLLYCLFSRNIRQALWNLFHSSSRNLRHSSEPLPLSRRRCPADLR